MSVDSAVFARQRIHALRQSRQVLLSFTHFPHEDGLVELLALFLTWKSGHCFYVPVVPGSHLFGVSVG